MLADLTRIVGLWRSRALWLALGIALAVLGVAASLGLMTLSASAIAEALVLGAFVAPAWTGGLGVARIVLRYLERLATHAATFRALTDLRVWFFRRLAATGAGGLGFRQAGDLLSRLVADIEALDGLYLRLIVPLATAVLLLPAIVILIGPHAPLLALAIASLFVLAAAVLPGFAARATRGAGERLAANAAALRITVLDALTGIREVRVFGAEGRMLAAMQAREGSLLAAQHALARRVALSGAGAFLCAQAAILAVLIAAGAQPLAAVAGAFLVIAAFEAVGGLPRAGAYAGHAAAAARRVIEAADTPIPVPDPETVAPTPRGNALRFEGVHFRWTRDRPPVFSGLGIDLHPGARVAVLGPSGSGKSTLAALMLKVASPDQGLVTLGGVDIATLPAAVLRGRIGWLSQTTHLFDDTIRANLLLARPDATDAELWTVLDEARIGDVVRALPDGLDTWVGESGARFSGGQGRRLALARVLLFPSPILVLDEPCAGLDAETERAFLTTLNTVAEGRTIVLIAHRLTGAERLDRIYRLSGGRAVAAAA